MNRAALSVRVLRGDSEGARDVSIVFIFRAGLADSAGACLTLLTATTE